MAALPLAVSEWRTFSIFISYASEDRDIAAAAATCFKTALPEYFAEVNFDKDFLDPGTAFKEQIEAKLQKTNVFIIIYTGVAKESYGYTGWEVGYFDHVMRMDPRNRKKIALYLFHPPDITISDEGIPLGLSIKQLQQNLSDFDASLSVSAEEPLCKKIRAWQDDVDEVIENTTGSRPPRRPEQEVEKSVRALRLAVFKYLKGTVESVVKPQKQIVIRVKGSALEQSSDGLPPEAEIRPLGALNTGGSMTIFGLSDAPITWAAFVELTASQSFSNSWQDAITSVVRSSFPEKVDVDNSQVILGSDGKTGYRVILTTATKFYDDYREYNLYFVEMLGRPSYGDQDTTELLKGLELVCRFRSIFLEPGSDFLGENLLLSDVHTIPDLASRLLRELNLMHRDAQDAGVDKPGKWTQYVNADHFTTIVQAFRPAESKLRVIIPKIMAAKSQPALLEALRKEMAELLTTMQIAVRPENTKLLREMAAKLNMIVEHQDQLSTTAALSGD